MREKIIIENTQKMNTPRSLESDLVNGGIEKNDILLVHSSLSSLGWVCGGPQTVIIALKEAVGKNGTLVMPAHSGDNSDPEYWQNPPVPPEWIEEIRKNIPPYDVYLTQTRGMGRIAELFRTQPETVRSDHPQTSFAAWGKYAEKITEQHILTPQFGLNSPIGKLYELGAKVLLMGVGYENNSCFHLAETMTENMPFKKCGAAITEKEKRIWKEFRDFDYGSAGNFNDIGNEMEEKLLVKQFAAGKSICRLFRITDAVDFAAKWIREKGEKIYGKND